MQYGVRLRTAVVFGLAALFLIAGIIWAVGNSPRLSSFIAGDKPMDKEEKGEEKYEALLEQELFWNDRVTYPTGRFDPEWLRRAVEQDSHIERGVPAGQQLPQDALQRSPLALDPNSFTAARPKAIANDRLRKLLRLRPHAGTRQRYRHRSDNHHSGIDRGVHRLEWRRRLENDQLLHRFDDVDSDDRPPVGFDDER